MTTNTTDTRYRVDTFRPGHVELTGGPYFAATPDTPNVESVTLSPLDKGFEVGSWRLKSLLLAEVHITRNSVVALTYLSGASEYGSGQTPEEALCDLVVSLGEYRQALEARENRLGESALRDLAALRNQVESVTATKTINDPSTEQLDEDTEDMIDAMATKYMYETRGVEGFRLYRDYRARKLRTGG